MRVKTKTKTKGGAAVPRVRFGKAFLPANEKSGRKRATELISWKIRLCVPTFTVPCCQQIEVIN
jgi:hypothetical protein